MALKVAINGTGRIGIIAAKIISGRSDIELVAINTTAKPEMLEYLLKFDSVHSGIDAKIIDKDTISIAGKNIRMFSERDISKLDFGSTGAEVVIECTGTFLDHSSCQKHLRNGVKKVVMSAPAKDDSPTYVLGVNSDDYHGEAIISNASCTTNCLAPMCKVLDDAFGIEDGLMTTIHAYTNDQNILDTKHRSDPRRGRAAALNMIPTTTGAAKAIGIVMPKLLGKLNGYAMRVPTPDVSVVDLTLNLKTEVTKEDINAAFNAAAKGAMKGILEVDNDKRVSSDFIGSTYSAIYIPDMTSVVGKKMVKVLGWYDNEWGYSCRLVDMTLLVGNYK
ncbi:MAG TPA: type I glyceraldehyde-3-phosphate dehydrogenase [Sulfurimonas sp.]|uniref:type I glyceraldehyde-3-phosphate dehydrogenase n=1 Tax=Sulfurimonas sp. TaxID=2022749 RepID=UPI002BE91D77|nr:type I glyceraldehyde-3-phosphate dehydrogenase [Sulfurimonas sp.]HUH41859.1 type I glyceraldehyde-3-phosphate dehydrogenase [Sulfurimonas sp.]